jgi:hypothetical protein
VTSTLLSSPSYFCFVATQKAMVVITFFSFFLLQRRRQRQQHHLFCCSVAKKVMATFYFGLIVGKKATTMNHGLLLWFHCNKEEEEDNIFCHLHQQLYTKWRFVPFLWFCCEEGDGNNVITFLYGGGVVEKAMVGSDFFPFFFLVVLLV